MALPQFKIDLPQIKDLIRGLQSQNDQASSGVQSIFSGQQQGSPTITAGKYGRPVNPSALPVGGRITQAFGVPQAVKAAGERTHAGVDIAVKSGTPIPEMRGGVVVESGMAKGYGNTVVVKGTDGRFRRYSHLASVQVKPGQRIGANDIVGLSGNTGASTGAHLDYREYVQ